MRDFRSDNEVADLGPDARSDGPTLLPDGPMPSTEVYVAPAQAAINGVGATTTVEIRVANVTKLYSFAIERSFDAAVVQIEDTDPRPSAPGVQVTPGDFFDLNQQVLVNKVDNAAGTVELAVTEAYPSTAQSGDGVLFSAIFKGSKAGSCPLHIGVARLPDDSHPDPLDIPAITKDGQLTVTP